MANLRISAPEMTEYPPSYESYISLVSEGDVLTSLERQSTQTLSLLHNIKESHGDFRYAPAKWSIKELVGHIIDAERIFSCRALRFARNDKTPLPGFDQDEYARAASFGTCRLSDLASEFESVRKSTIFLLQNLSEEAWMRTGKANDNEISVRALAYIIAGHELHHRKVLESKYLPVINTD